MARAGGRKVEGGRGRGGGEGKDKWTGRRRRSINVVVALREKNGCSIVGLEGDGCMFRQ